MTEEEYQVFFRIISRYCIEHELTKHDLSTLLGSLMLDMMIDTGLDEEFCDSWCEYLKKEYRIRLEETVK